MTLEAFRFVQDHFIGILATLDIVIKHEAYQDNAALLEDVIDALDQGTLSNEEGSGAGSDLDDQWRNRVSFSVETNAASKFFLLEKSNPVFWGTGKGAVLADTYPATVSLLEKAERGNSDFSEEIALYTRELEERRQLKRRSVRKAVWCSS